MNYPFKNGDIVSGYDGGLILKYIGNDTGIIMYISPGMYRLLGGDAIVQIGTMWAMSGVSLYKECSAYYKYLILEKLHGSK